MACIMNHFVEEFHTNDISAYISDDSYVLTAGWVFKTPDGSWLFGYDLNGKIIVPDGNIEHVCEDVDEARRVILQWAHEHDYFEDCTQQ